MNNCAAEIMNQVDQLEDNYANFCLECCEYGHPCNKNCACIYCWICYVCATHKQPCISSNCMYAVEILFENPKTKTKEL